MKISVLTPTIRPDGLRIMQESLKTQTFKDFEWLVDINVTGEHDLNASFNRLIKRSTGELIVFYEDYTRITPEGLERFWKAYQDNPQTLFTAPLGKTNSFEPNTEIRWDWRATKQTPQQTDYTDCLWQTCELDWGAIPRDIIYAIGGFDEELDKWWSMDNVSVGNRAYLHGYKFKCVFTNPAVAFDHDAFIEHPFRKRFNSGAGNARLQSYNPGEKLPYLD